MLEALGRLMLSFTELDLVITMQLEVYVGCESDQLAGLFIRDLRFTDKVAKFRALIRIHADNTGLSSSRVVRHINAILDRATECAKGRNHLAHGLVRFDTLKKCFVSTLKEKEYVLRTKALNDLAASMTDISAGLFVACIAFTDAIAPRYLERGTSEYFAGGAVYPELGNAASADAEA